MANDRSENENAPLDKELIQSAFKQLCEMVRKQDALIQSWTKFYLYIQAGLAVALSFLLQLGPSQNLLAIAGSAIIPVLGIATVFFLTRIIIREYKWQGRYVGQITKLPMVPEVYRREWAPKEPDPDKRGYNAQQIWLLQIVLITGWCILLLVSIGSAYLAK